MMMMIVSAMFLSNLVYSGYNVITIYGRNDILDGLVSIMVVTFFCAIGVFSHNLAYK